MNINVPFEKLENIAHLADVHIRLFKRHKEYRETFETLYEQLREKLKGTNSVIVVAGDIIHTKLDLSPESVGLVSEFLKTLSNIAPTLVIAGNHDCNLANSHRMDSLTPIIDNLGTKNLYYLKHSGVYTIADTQFGVFSILDERSQWPEPTELTADTKICLYHGPVYGAKTDSNFTITSRHVSSDMFNGYDVVLLGDIHKYQVLQEYNSFKKLPVIVYASSLIQQNHGESLNGHGWCLWDVQKKSHDFIELPSKYGYLTLEVKSGKVNLPTSAPENLRIRLFTNGLQQTKVQRLVSSIKKKYNVLELSINPNTLSISSKSQTTSTFNIGDLTDINIQNNLISDWIKRNHPSISDETIENVHEINKKINELISYKDQSRNVNWKPLEFQFSNLLSFGEDNYIDFSKLQGSNGIFAANATGKSASMDALIFTLFDKTPRAFRGDHIMNNRKSKFSAMLTFEVDEVKYVIQRVGTRKTNGSVRVDVNFSKIDENDELISLNGEDRFDTNANIRSIVGTYEDFILTSLSGQFGSSIFIDKSNTERKILLNQFMGLDIFEHLYLSANESSKELQGVLKKFNREDFTAKLAELQSDIESLDLKLLEIDANVIETNNKIEDIETQISENLSKKKQVPEINDTKSNIESVLTGLYSRKKSLSNNISQIKEELDTEKLEMDALHDRIYKDFDEDTIYSKYQEYEHLLLEKNDVNSSIKESSTSLDNKNDIHSRLSKFKHNPECEICKENNKDRLEQIQTINSEILELVEQMESDENKLESIEKSLLELKLFHTKWEEHESLKKKHSELTILYEKQRNTLSKYETQLYEAQLSIDKNKELLSLINQNEDNLKFNRDIDDKNNELKKRLIELKSDLEEIQKNKLELHGNRRVSESRRAEIIDELKEISNIESQFEAYKYYIEAISRDGLPYELISKVIPNLEGEINTVLSQIVDFKIALDVDGKNFGGRIVYAPDRSWPLENSSGMERFISSLAIRIALLKASNLPKSNFLIIDEGMGSLDSENRHSIQTLLTMLKSEFDFMIVISHIDEIRDMVDNLIEITKENGYSYINTDTV